jgi:hypothetical protein
MLENINYLPRKLAKTGEAQNAVFLEMFINNYFKSTLRRIYSSSHPDIVYNEIGLVIVTYKVFFSFGFI